MGSILILGSILCITILILSIRSWSDFWEGVLPIFFLSFVASLLIVAVGSLFFPQHEVSYKIEHDIVSLDDTSSTEGGFFLGIGSIRGRQKYSFYYVIDNEVNTYKRKNVSASMTYIKEGHDNPKIVYHYKGTSVADKYKGWVVNYKDTPSVYRIDLFVPEGTIIKEIGLDNRD